LISLYTNTKQNGDLYIHPVFDETQLWCWSSASGSSAVVIFVDFLKRIVVGRDYDSGLYVRAEQ